MEELIKLLKTYWDAQLQEENKKLREQLELYTDEWLYNKLCEIDERCWDDSEARHADADALIEKVLRNFWFNKAMDKYDEMEFRYA